ncbi:MAG: hypothetical protein JO265_04120 [Acidimicrobiia bacterium]|nr:hypothetical protein [Acidimicrobiia bacterium]
MIRRLVAVCVIAAGVLGACAAPRQTLGTRSSLCFRSLPTASAAVHQHGHLLGVRQVGRAHVLRVFPQAELPPGRYFCAVGFSDDFQSAQVDAPAGAPAGKYALVVVTVRGTTVVRTYLLDRLPFALRHP